VIQNVPGIIAADLNSLYLSTDSAGTLDSVLPPINIFVDSLTHELKPVPLLIINPAGIKVSKMETPS